MTFSNFIFLVVIPSGLIGALAGGIVTHFSNKKLDMHKRMMDVRKESYTKINELFSAFYDTTNDEISKQAYPQILKLHREIQLWGSDEVIRRFQELLFAIDVKNNVTQKDRNLTYKSFVIAMRKDILSETDIMPEEIQMHGLIEKL